MARAARAADRATSPQRQVKDALTAELRRAFMCCSGANEFFGEDDLGVKITVRGDRITVGLWTMTPPSGEDEMSYAPAALLETEEERRESAYTQIVRALNASGKIEWVGNSRWSSEGHRGKLSDFVAALDQFFAVNNEKPVPANSVLRAETRTMGAA